MRRVQRSELSTVVEGHHAVEEGQAPQRVTAMNALQWTPSKENDTDSMDHSWGSLRAKAPPDKGHHMVSPEETDKQALCAHKGRRQLQAHSWRTSRGSTHCTHFGTGRSVVGAEDVEMRPLGDSAAAD